MFSFPERIQRIPVELLVFGVALLSYVLTAGPVIQAGDSGELVTAAFQMGVPHPPGYPIFLLWEKCWMTVCPLGSMAFRATWGTSVAAALSVMLTVGIARRMGRRVGLSGGWLGGSLLSMGLALAWSKTLWSEAVEAEVYTLHVLILAAIGWVMVARPRQAWWIALMVGLGIAHHHSFLVSLPLLALALWHQPVQHGWRTGLLFGLLVGLGLTVYGLLMIRSLANPLMDWGNPETWTGLMAHAVRKQYGTISRLPRSWSLWSQQIGVVGTMVWQQMTPWACLLGVMGGAWCMKRWKGWGAGTVGLWASWTMGIVWLLNFPLTDELIETVEVFFIPAHLLMGLFMVAGVWWLIGSSATLGLRNGSFGLAQGGGFGMVRRGAAGILMGAIPLATLNYNFSFNDRSRNFLTDDYARNILSSVDPGGVLLTKGDNQMFPLAASRWIDQVAPSVRVFDDYGYIFTGLYGEDFGSLSESDQAARRENRLRALWQAGGWPVCYTAAAAISMLPDVQGLHQGLVYRAFRQGDQVASRVQEPLSRASQLWRRYVQRGVDDPRVYKTYLASNVGAQYHYFLGKYFLWRGALALARREFDRATMTGYAMESMFNNVAVEYYEMRQFDEALTTLKRARDMNPQKAEIHWNIGTVYLTTGRPGPAVEAYREALKWKPAYVDALVKLGEAYFALGQATEAVNVTQQALDLYPNHAHALSNFQKFTSAIRHPPSAIP